MSEKLEALAKGKDSKRAIHANRKKGLIPVNLYGHGIEKSFNFYVEELSLNRAVKSGKKVHDVATGQGDFQVVFREVQRHPVTWKLTHVDMMALMPGKKVTVRIPLRYEGVPFGVKNMGGVFITNSRDIVIEALPENVPNEIIIDVSPLKLKDTVHAADVERENIKVVSPGGMLLARVGITRAAVSAAGGLEVHGEEGSEPETEAAKTPEKK